MTQYYVYAYDNDNGLLIQQLQTKNNARAFEYFDMLSFNAIGMNVTIELFKNKQLVLKEVKQ